MLYFLPLNKKIKKNKQQLGKGNKQTRSVESFSWILDDNQEVVFIWCYHDLVFLGANPQEGEVILGVDVSHSAPCLHDEAVHEACVLNRCGVVHSTFDRNTFRVHNNDSLHSLLALNSLQCFFHLSLQRKHKSREDHSCCLPSSKAL